MYTDVINAFSSGAGAMFLPPDVSGWPGYRTWINTYTLPWRKTFTGALVDGHLYNFDIGIQMDALRRFKYSR